MVFEKVMRGMSAALVSGGLATVIIMMFVRATPVPATPGDGECDLCPPVGQEICCPGTSKAGLEALGYSLTVVTSSTTGCFIVTSCTPPPECNGTQWNVTMDLNHFEGDATDPNLGTIHWRNDPDRPATPATLKSNGEGRAYPATGTISFYAVAQIDGIDGEYKSDEEILLVNNNVNSFNPFVSELFTRPSDAEPITFTNETTGDKITLHDLSSELN